MGRELEAVVWARLFGVAVGEVVVVAEVGLELVVGWLEGDYGFAVARVVVVEELGVFGKFDPRFA